MQFRIKEYWLDKGIQLSDKEGYYGTPFRYWINQNVRDYISKYCPDKNATILDIGCGWGRYSEFFTDLHIKGKYLGIDINRSEYWKCYIKDGLEIKYKEFDAMMISNIELQFNFAISITSLEHIKDDMKALKEIKKALFYNTYILLIVPSRFTLFLYGKNHGYHRYSRKSLLKLASASELQIVELIPIGGLPSYIFHFIWTIPGKVSFRVGKLLKTFFPKLTYGNKENIGFRICHFLDNIMWLHLKTRSGKFLHKQILKLCIYLDKFLPIFEVGYLVILTKIEKK